MHFKCWLKELAAVEQSLLSVSSQRTVPHFPVPTCEYLPSFDSPFFSLLTSG
jgi:hypothetical protein